tara:strand:- start:502 stop:801 length:300 start_codon:yes stop_codon:yes gene_type:complete
MPELIVKGKKKKYKYTEEGVRSYKEQLAKNKKMPKKQPNWSSKSLNREEKDPHYQPVSGWGPTGARPLKNQDPEKKSVKKTKKRIKGSPKSPPKPQKGY